MRDAAGELDDFEAAGDLALGVGEDLAVLLADDPRQGVVLAVQQFEELEHDACAGQRRRRGPAGKRRPGGLHGLIDRAGAGKGDAADFFAGRRIEDIAPAPAPTVAGGLDALAVDEMMDFAHALYPPAEMASGPHHMPRGSR